MSLGKRMHYALGRHKHLPREVARLGRHLAKQRQELMLSPGKILMPGNRHLRLTAKHWSKHVLIAGGSGQGKSKLQELLCRQQIDQGQGFTFIDPHGDTAKALLLYCAVAGIDPSRVIYLKPTTDMCFSIDLLADAPATDGPNRALKLASWIDSTADRIIRAFIRTSSAADQDMMKRLKHRMRTLIWCCAVDVDGKHLGLADMKVLADPARPEFGAVLDRIGPRLLELKPEVYHELEKVRNTRSESTLDKWMESTTNLLDETLGVILQLVFGQHGTALDFKAVIREREILLVDLSETDELSRAQGNVIGGFILSFLINTARKTPEEERVDHYLFVDEAENYVGEDMRMAFSELRKFRMPLCIAFQDLSCLRKGDLDLVERVISICCVWFIFQQQDPENIEYLGKALKFGSLDMTPLLAETTLPDGYDWVDTESYNVGSSLTSSLSVAESLTHTSSETLTRSTSESIQESVSLALSRADSDGETWTDTDGGTRSWSSSTALSRTNSNARSRALAHGKAESEQDGSSYGRTRSEQENAGASSSDSESASHSYGPGGDTRSMGAVAGRARSESHGRGTAENMGESHTSGKTESYTETLTSGSTKSAGRTSTIGRTDGEGWSSSDGGSLTRSRGLAFTLGLAKGRSAGWALGRSRGFSLGITRGRTEGEGFNVGITLQKTPLARHRFLRVPNGKTVVAAADQFYSIMNVLAALPERTVLMKVKGMDAPFLLEVHEVLDPYAACGKPERSKAWRDEEREQFLARVHEAPFYFVPTDADHRGRVARFLGAAVAGGAVPRPAGFVVDEENPIA